MDYLYHVDIPLWEWDVDTMLVQGVVDALQHVADDEGALGGVNPHDEFEVHA